ncbi:hypothetical protein K438DRAFT_1937337 [Mycena galopus ATCC 62051]|nr:hypothetical protein K438DRAFT_1937337 [Mycena galopus ATCC 62051]
MGSSKEGGHSNSLDNAQRTQRFRWLTRLFIGIAVCFLIFAAYRKDSGSCTSGRHKRRIGSVKWSHASECSPGIQCGSVIVPNDYFDPSAGTASMAIAIFKATKSPKTGTVFLNPANIRRSSLLLMYLERPPQWADSALALSQAMAGNGTLLFNTLATPRPLSTPYYDLAWLGVTCLDSPPPRNARRGAYAGGSRCGALEDDARGFTALWRGLSR